AAVAGSVVRLVWGPLAVKEGKRASTTAGARAVWGGSWVLPAIEGAPGAQWDLVVRPGRAERSRRRGAEAARQAPEGWGGEPVSRSRLQAEPPARSWLQADQAVVSLTAGPR